MPRLSVPPVARWAGVLLAPLASLPAVAQSHSLSLETGAVFVGRNDARIPGDSGTRFSLRRLQGSGGAPYLRLEYLQRLRPGHGLRLLYAPLQLERTGTPEAPIRFAGTDFASGAPTQAQYRFSSYRATYFSEFRRGRVDGRIGLTLKVRDARIRLAQPDRAAADSNVGLVPLLYLSGAAPLGGGWTLSADCDGLAAPQGRAFDASVRVTRAVAPNLRAYLGYRTLEGGADNDRVYSFAWLHYASVGLTRVW
jgi:hypothetical protein